jgi:hypothetical protein
MKKGYVVLMLSLLIIVVSVAGIVYAVPCTDGDSPTGCVCGRSPNTALGYGQVIIGGATPSIISCNNIGDGVCPEDFSDAFGVSANCNNCPDPDCTVRDSLGVGYVWGYVNDSNNKRIENVIITGHAIKWNNSASLEKSTPTDSYGRYESNAFLSGKYFFSASKKGYDTQLLEATIVRGQITRLDFKLENGTCHPDCTNSYNRCNPDCDGVTFSGSDTKCSFFDAAVKGNCTNRLKGTNVTLGKYNATHTYEVVCCENAPTIERHVKPNSDVISPWIKDLSKGGKIARLNEYPVTVVVSYWTRRN